MIANGFGWALLIACLALGVLGIFEFRRRGHVRMTAILLLILGVIYLIWLASENPGCLIGLIIVVAFSAAMWVMLKKITI